MTALLPAHPPRARLPAGACDCHMHIYGDPALYPPAPGNPFQPVAGGTTDNYLKLQALLGLERAVVVQPSVYGTDNRCTLEAMARLGQNARGVAVVDETVSDAEIQRLNTLGVRGLRYFMLADGPLNWENLPRMAARVHAVAGWHIQLQMDGRLFHEREAELSRLPGTLVIDHNGKFLEPVGREHPGYAALRRLLDRGNAWVKTSGVYETSREGPPRYSDVAWIARELIANYPERCVWATNWPHPSKPGSPPDDALLVDLMSEWCDGEAGLRRLLVENPARLYGF
jgi:D-galactarolactone isomerase